jgi:hypothetical protein
MPWEFRVVGGTGNDYVCGGFGQSGSIRDGASDQMWSVARADVFLAYTATGSSFTIQL